MIAGSAFNVSAEIARQQRLAQDIAGLQTDISTQVRVHVASDDPVAAAQIARIGVSQADGNTYAANVDRASAIADQVDTSLSGLQTSLTRAKELMVQAANGTLSATDRAAIVTELQGIADDVATAAKATDSSGNPLYAQGGDPVAIPVGRGVAVAAAESYDQVFGQVALADGSTASIASLLGTAISAVQSGDTGAMSGAIAGVDASLTHVGAVQEDAGVRAARVKTIGDRLATQKTDLADERSGLEDTDTTAAYATLSQKMTTLNAAQQVLASLGKLSLFDKLG